MVTGVDWLNKLAVVFWPTLIQRFAQDKKRTLSSVFLNMITTLPRLLIMQLIRDKPLLTVVGGLLGGVDKPRRN
jgi:hypothetical protein